MKSNSKSCVCHKRRCNRTTSCGDGCKEFTWSLLSPVPSPSHDSYHHTKMWRYKCHCRPVLTG